MFKKEKHNHILIIATLLFGVTLELIYFRPSLLFILLGYLLVFLTVFCHYDLHLEKLHINPFKKAWIKHKHRPAIEKWGTIVLTGLYNRFHHFYKKDNLLPHLVFLIQPSFLYWSTSSLLFFFVDPLFSQILIFASTMAYMLILASISGIYSKALKVEEKHFHLLSITKTLVVFLSLMASYGYFYFGFVNHYNAIVLVLATTVVLLFQFAWKSGKLFTKSLAWPAVFWSGLFLSSVAFALVSARVGFVFAVVSLFASYYLCFGLLRHYLKGDLTKKLFWEHLIVAILLVTLVWGNTYFDKLVL
jgi:hypothetical protein